MPKVVKTFSGKYVAYGRYGGPVKVPEHRIKALGLGDKFKGLKSTHEVGETEYEMLTE